LDGFVGAALRVRDHSVGNIGHEQGDDIAARYAESAKKA
jgi:hypothetical protein